MKRILFALLLAASPAFGDDLVKVGSTDICHDVFVSDSSSNTGAGLTGVAYNASGLTCKYKRSNQTTAQITTMTLVDGTVATHLDNSWKEVANGWYQICPPDAAYASGRYVDVWCYGATNMAPMNLRVVFMDNIPDVNIVSSDISISGTKGQR